MSRDTTFALAATAFAGLALWLLAAAAGDLGAILFRRLGFEALWLLP